MNKYHPDGTTPQNGEIFVFGSNQSGIHGAGAAAAARLSFRAEWGIIEGLTGQSYAIPTKNFVVDNLTLSEIRVFVERFIEFTKNNPNLNFFVTRVGCGLAGNKDSDIAPMFIGAINCSFPDTWKEYLEKN